MTWRVIQWATGGVGKAAVGVTATTDVDELLAMEADCVVYAPLLPDPAVVARILRSGKSVVTPVGWVYPDLATAGELEEACPGAGACSTARVSIPAGSPNASR